jgi:hypothetical protein
MLTFGIVYPLLEEEFRLGPILKDEPVLGLDNVLLLLTHLLHTRTESRGARQAE